MTGFGTATLEKEDLTITVEVKSINSKSQDFSLRLPRQFQDKEYEIKNLMIQLLDRGKVSLSVDVAKRGKVKPKLTINPDIFKAYTEDLRKNAAEANIQNPDLLSAVLTLPEVFDTDKTEADNTELWESTLEIIKKGIEQCNNFRKDEGKKLQEQLLFCIKTIDKNLSLISEQDGTRITKLRERITQKVEEHIKAEHIDANRFEQELIFYIEKLDISEEKVRLKTHLDYFEETMHLFESNGKKLGFISQEIGREINTIGSKANDAHIQKWVVEMKEELEKIKEQSLNIL